MRKIVILGLTLLVATSCGDHATDPVPFQPSGNRDISDADNQAFGDHNPGVWWLPPIVEKQPTTITGTFQGALSPIVKVVCVASNQPDCGADPEIDTFTKGDGLIVETDHFKVDFDTHSYPQLQTTSEDRSLYTTYRIEVYTESLFGSTLLMAYADFQLAENGREARSLTDDYMIALVDNQTLPIRFFVNEFAYQYELETNPVSTGEPGGTLCQINCTVAVLEPGVATEVSLFDENGVEQTAVEFDGDETVVRRILIIDEKDPDVVDPAMGPVCAPGYNARKMNCFGYETFPSTDPAPLGVPFAAEFRIGVCPVGITFGSGIWALTEVDFDAQGNPIVEYPEEQGKGNDVSDFLPCGGSTVLTFLRPLLDLIVRPLYAEDTKVWGARDDDFSHWLWSAPAQLEHASGGGSVDEGQPVELSARVLGTHPLHDIGVGDVFTDPTGVPGAEVTFTVAAGSGVLSGADGIEMPSITVETNSDGIATVTLRAGAGTNLVHAQSPHAQTADGGPVAFAITGLGLISQWNADATDPDAYGDVADGNHGVVTGDVPLVPGVEGTNAFAFNGDGSHIAVPGTDWGDAKRLTVALWVRLNPESSRFRVQRFVIAAPGEKVSLRQNHQGEGATGRALEFYMGFGVADEDFSDVRRFTVADALVAGCWQHVAGTYDGTTMRAYVDGLEVGSLVVEDALRETSVSVNNMLLSFDDPAEALDGDLDDVRIYNKALTASEIAALADGVETGCKPDLVITGGVTATPESVAPGGTVTLGEWIATNQGNAPVPAGTVVNAGYYLSPDATITAADVFLGSSFITNEGWAVNQQLGHGALSFTVPAATAPGTYFLGVLIDNDAQVQELDETNNFGSASVAVAAADLIVSSLTHSPEPASSADPVTITAIVRNAGVSTSAASTVSLAIGPNVLGTGSIPALAGGETASFQVTATLAEGQHAVSATADANGDVVETDESNNTTSHTFTVWGPTDLFISGTLTADPIVVAPGGGVTLSDVTVGNNGIDRTSDFLIGWYLSPDAAIANTDVRLRSIVQRAGIETYPPGETRTLHGQVVTVPAGTAEGSYYIGIFIDDFEAISESDETNNVITVPITVEVPVAASDVLWAVNSDDDGLSRIDPVTGNATFVGALGNYSTALAMAVRPSDEVLFVNASADIVTVDRCTGVPSLFTNASILGGLGGLAFDPSNGTLYGAGTSLVVVTSEGLEVIGSIQNAGELGVYALDFAPDGTLYGVTSGGNLLAINKADASSTLLGGIVDGAGNPIGVPGSLVFDATGQALLSLGGTLHELDLGSRVVTPLFSTSPNTFMQGLGFASVPSCS